MKDLQHIYDMLELARLRFFVDDIDMQLVRLLNKRFEYCLEISKMKEHVGKSIVDLKRQKQVLENVENCSKKGFEQSNKLIFSIVMLLSTLLQIDDL